MYVKMEVQVVKYKHLVLENSFLCMCKETICLGFSNHYFLGKSFFITSCKLFY